MFLSCFGLRRLLCKCLLLGLLILTALTLNVMAGAHRADPKISVRFHVQTNEFDGNFSTPVTLLHPQRTIYVEKVPSINERDITSFSPYSVGQGNYSVAFQLDRHGQLTLQNLSAQRRGQMLIVAVNNRIITSLTIDRTITDGIIYVPFGFSEAEIKALGESYPLTTAKRLSNKPDVDPDSNPLAPTAPTPRP